MAQHAKPVQEKQIVPHVQQQQTNVQHVIVDIIQMEVDVHYVLQKDVVNVMYQQELVQLVQVDIS